MNLTGRSAIVTGASQGLGKAIAERFVAAGADVFLVARGEAELRKTAEELRQFGRKVEVMPADVSDDAACGAITQRAIKTFGHISILVNNAGVYGPMGRIEEIDWSQWLAAIQVNLFGTVQMCRHLIPHLRSRGYGKIINLSGGGATAPLPMISAYAASKAAVVRLTETFAEELKDAHVDVNAIAPGALNTRLLDEVLSAGPDKVGKQFYERSVKQRQEGGAPLEKGAELTTFLASAASDGITGRLLSAVWDKWAELPDHREQLAGSDIYTLRRIVPQDRNLTW